MARLPVARAHGKWLLVDEAAAGDRLHGRFGVGELGPKGLRLHPVEAVWLAGEGRLSVEAHGATQTLGALLSREAGPSLEVAYLAYRDLRERGLLARPDDDGTGFHVWPRGAGLRARPAYTVRTWAERSPVPLAALAGWAERRDVAAVVDEDGDVTHYQVEPAAPEGKFPPANLAPASGVLLEDRVLVEAPADATALAEEHIGAPHGPGRLLSLVEGEALRRRGALAVSAEVGRRGAAQHTAFRAILSTYEALRERGVVVRSGFRFGTHLRGYRADPKAGHAEWLVHCAEGDSLPWSDVSRGVRLAHGVRKSFLVAWPRGDDVRFLDVKWFRP